MFRKSAFTLVEVLTVVAIIALLVCMLMPSLGRASALAKQTACKATLRSNANVWTQKSVETGGVLKWPLGKNKWYYITTASGGSDKIDYTYSDFTGEDYLAGMYFYDLKPWGMSGKLNRCALDKEPKGANWTKRKGLVRNAAQRATIESDADFYASYIPNDNVVTLGTTDAASPATVHQRRVSPAKTFLLIETTLASETCDNDRYVSGLHWSGRSYQTDASNSELAWGMASFLDGHVESFRWDRCAQKTDDQQQFTPYQSTTDEYANLK